MTGQKSLFPQPKPSSWERHRHTMYVVQIKGQSGAWMDHAAYDSHDWRRARQTAHGLRATYKDTPNVSVRVVKKER